MSPQNPSSSINNDSNQRNVPVEKDNTLPSNSIPTNSDTQKVINSKLLNDTNKNEDSSTYKSKPPTNQDGDILVCADPYSANKEPTETISDELCEMNMLDCVAQNDPINNIGEESANAIPDPEAPSPPPANGSITKGEVPDLINYGHKSSGDSDSKENTASNSAASQRSPHYSENLDEIIWHPIMDEESNLNLEYKSHINNIQAENRNTVHTRASSLSTIQLSSSASGVDNDNLINYISYENNAKNDIYKQHEEGPKSFDDEICKHRRRRNNRQSLSSSRGCWVFKTTFFSTLCRRLSKWRKGRRESSFSTINAPLEGINILSNSVDGKLCESNIRATTNELPPILPKYNSTLSISSSENSTSASLPNKSGKYSIINKVSTSGVKIIPLEKQAPKIQEFSQSDASSSRTSSENDELNIPTSNNRPHKINMSIKSRLKNRRKHGKEQHQIENELGSSSSSDSSKDVKSPQLSSRGQHIKAVRTKRLMKEFGALTHISESSANPIFSVALINDCLYEWKVKLYRVDPDSLLNRDMVEYGVPFILLNMSFPNNFPFQPPFLRVISPKIEKGFVMEGGAICMELLTPKGWASAYTVEAVIMQLAASLVKGHGRINRHSTREFNKKVAEASFRSLVRTHDKYGWVTPPLAEG